MQKSSLLLIGVFMSASATLSFAGPQHGKGKFMGMFDVNKDEMVTLAELGEASESRFSTMDGDSNGVVSHDEFKNHMQSHRTEYKQKKFAAMDSDSDSKITLAEFSEYKLKKIEKRFASMDGNADGVLSAEEFSSHRKAHHGHGKKGMGHGHKGGKRVFDKLDSNGDKQITKEEAMTAWSNWFNKLDANSDGTVTAEEASKSHMNKHAVK